jgi:spore germination protein (amino acid permease)
VASNGKISLRQAMLTVLVITHTPALRIIPISTAAVSRQAAWLAPVISFVFLLPVIFALKSIYRTYEDRSFAEILELVFGSLIGKTLTFFYVIFLFILLTVNATSTGEQLVGSIYPNVDPAFFIFVMLAVTAFTVYKGGLTVITRMGEIILPYLMIAFLILCSLASQNIELSRITPISYLDIVPVLKSSFVISGVQAHLPLVFLLGNYINNKEKIGRYCTITAFMYLSLLFVLLVTVIGSLGAEITASAPLPFITAVKLISLFNSIERIEPLVIGMWILSDFLLISVLLISLLNMYRSLFKLSQTKNYIIITLVIIYFLAMMLGRNMFEIQRFLEVFLTPMMVFGGFALPLIVFITGKARKLL